MPRTGPEAPAIKVVLHEWESISWRLRRPLGLWPGAPVATIEAANCKSADAYMHDFKVRGGEQPAPFLQLQSLATGPPLQNGIQTAA